MLSSVPTKEKNKPRNWTVTILVGVILILSAALSGLAGLYLSNNHLNQPTIIVNQSANNTSNYNQTVQDASRIKNQANSSDPNSNTHKNTQPGTSSGDLKNQTTK